MKMDKAKVENCIAKTRAFYDTKAVGCALLKVKNIATLPSPALSLTDYTFPDVYKRQGDCPGSAGAERGGMPCCSRAVGRFHRRRGGPYYRD